MATGFRNTVRRHFDAKYCDGIAPDNSESDAVGIVFLVALDHR